MGLFQIGFLILNLTVPYFIWSHSSKKGSNSDSGVWEKSLTRIVASDGGFPNCTTLEVVDIFHDLCDNSKAKLKGKEVVTMERASPEVVFSCEYSEESIRVAWHLEKSEKSDIKCGDPGGDIISHGPGFIFALNGRLRAIDFTATKGVREVVPMRNCRIKLAQAKTLKSAPAALDDFLQALGHVAEDPEDFLTANFMCFVFDLSPQWQAWRAKYPR